MTQTQNQSKTAYRALADLTETERHRLLTAPDRRILLKTLSTQSAPVQLETVARELVKSKTESETTETSITKTKAKLHHTHLPLMDDLKILSYDPETNWIDFADRWNY